MILEKYNSNRHIKNIKIIKTPSVVSPNFASFTNKRCSIPHCGPVLSTWPRSTPGDRELNKLESTLPEDAYTQVSTFLAKHFFKNVTNLHKF